MRKWIFGFVKNDLVTGVVVAYSSATSLADRLHRGCNVKIVPLNMALNSGACLSDIGVAPSSICTRRRGANRLPGAATTGINSFVGFFSSFMGSNGAIVRFSLSDRVSSACGGTLLTTDRLRGICVISSGGLSANVNLIILTTYRVTRGNVDTGRVARGSARLAGYISSSFMVSDLRCLRGNKHYDTITVLNTGLLGLGPYVSIAGNGVSMDGGCHNGCTRILGRCISRHLNSVSSVSLDHVFVARTNYRRRVISTICRRIGSTTSFGRVLISHTNYAISSRYNTSALNVLFIHGSPGTWFYVLCYEKLCSKCPTCQQREYFYPGGGQFSPLCGSGPPRVRIISFFVVSFGFSYGNFVSPTTS